MRPDGPDEPVAATGRGRRSPLYGLVGAYLVSETGTAMAAIAIPWLVLVTTGSAASTGIIGFAQMAPYVTLQAIGGPLADRVGLRRTCLLGNAAAAAAMCAIPILHTQGDLRLGVFAALVAVAGAVRGIADAATSPLVPRAAALGDIALERAAGLNSAANRTAMLIGMPLAGVLIAVTSAPTVVLIDALTFLTAAAMIAALVPASTTHDDRPVASFRLRGYVADLSEGTRFLRRDQLLLGIVAVTAVTNLLDEAFLSVLLPVWVHDRVHQPQALGLVGGTTGIGLLLGVLLGAWLGPRLPRRATYAVGFLQGGSPPFLALAASASLPPILTVSAVSGLAAGVLNPINGAVLYEHIPPRLQARVFGTVKASAWIGIPFGSLLGGLLADTAGLILALLGAGALMLITTIAPSVFPAWRGLNRPPAPTPAAKTVDSAS